ncbi:Cysteine desulfurase IscS [Planctomycetales bacterium 10988]|nr:Cysteine desulfurase IscS [Planctomycetales bacterium 10988]
MLRHPNAPIFLDHHATTPLDYRVAKKMEPLFLQPLNAGNRSHAWGRKADQIVLEARQMIADCLHASPEEIVFTSGATESNNLAIKGIAAKQGGHLVSIATEHPSVLAPLKRLRRQGFNVTILPVDRWGNLDFDQFQHSLTAETVLVSIMLANHETALIHPISQLASCCRERKIPFHCDATQAIGKIPVDLSELPVDILSFSSHKLYGPPGIGGLLVRKESGSRLEPQMEGGKQQANRRSGTLPVALIAGFAEAFQLAVTELSTRTEILRGQRDRLWQELNRRLDGLVLHGPELHENRLAQNLFFGVKNIPPDRLLSQLKQIAVSSGSACSSGISAPSEVLLAMGCSEALALSSIRICLGRWTTENDINIAVEDIVSAVQNLRKT